MTTRMGLGWAHPHELQSNVPPNRAARKVSLLLPAGNGCVRIPWRDRSTEPQPKTRPAPGCRAMFQGFPRRNPGTDHPAFRPCFLDSLKNRILVWETGQSTAWVTKGGCRPAVDVLLQCRMDRAASGPSSSCCHLVVAGWVRFGLRESCWKLFQCVLRHLGISSSS